MSFELNIWSAIFLLSIGQGIFLITVLLLSQKLNTTSKNLFCLLLLVLLLTCLDYFTVASAVYKVVPFFFGISNGMILLLGPLLYLYIRSVTVAGFRLTHRHWLHIIPYLLNAIINLPLLLLPATDKIQFIDWFISGSVPLTAFFLVLFVLQTLHLGLYLFLSYGKIKAIKENEMQAWLKGFAFSIILYGLCVAILLGIAAYSQKLNLYANYTYTLAMCAITYFLAYKVLLKEGVLFPKPKKQLANIETDAIVKQLKKLMQEQRPFLNPDYRLDDLAKDLGVQKNYVSQVLNQHLQQSFPDFINAYRIEEFKRRLVMPEFKHISIYGLALDAGFNSKSSFNAAFKKHTRYTPTEYKKEVEKGLIKSTDL